MLKKLPIKMLVALLAAMMTWGLGAQAQIIVRQVGGASGMKSEFSLNESLFQKKTSPNGNYVSYVKKVKNAEGDLTVTPQSNQEEGFSLDMAVVLDPAIKYPVASLVNDQNQLAPISLPKGVYDLVVSYTYEDEEYRQTTYLVFQQGIELNSDTTWVFSPSDAKNHVTTAIYDENNDVISAANGNAGQTVMDCGVYVYNLFAVASFSLWGSVDFYISDVKDADIWASVAMERSGWDNPHNTYYVNKIHYLGDINDDFVIMNDKDSYVRHDQYFKMPKCADSKIQVSHDNIRCSSVLFLDPEGLFSTTTQFVSVYDVTADKDYYEKNPITIYLNNPVSQHSIDTNPANIAVQVGVIERQDTTDVFEWEDEVYYLTDDYVCWSPKLALDDNRDLYYVNEENPLFVEFSLKTDGALSIKLDESKPVMLNKTCQVQMFPYAQTKNWTTALQSYYMGIYGEYHEMNGNAKMSFNDDLVYEGDSLNTFLSEWNGNKGRYVIDTYCDDFNVGDMEGSNTTHFEFDNKGFDQAFPLIQMLQFRDKDSNVTPYFDTYEGNIWLSTGNIRWNGYQYYEYDGTDATTLSVAPHGSDQWEDISLEKTATEVRSYGDFFKADLSTITGRMEGWYDVRIDVETAKGKMTQVLSPAFCIGDPSQGMAGITQADNRVVARYSVAGCQLNGPQKGLNIVRMADGKTYKVLTK